MKLLLKFKIPLLITTGLLIITGSGYFGFNFYKNYQIQESKKEKFRDGEIAYQKCINKATEISIMTYTSISGENKETIFNNSQGNEYFKEWANDGKLYYNPKIGYWKMGFIKWIIEKHPEVCREYNIGLIDYFINEETKINLELSDLTNIESPPSNTSILDKQDQQSSEIENLKKEIDELKKQQTQNDSELQSSPKSESTNYGINVFDEWAKRAVRVTCSYEGYAHLENGEIVEGSGEYIEVEKMGSGTLFYQLNAEIPFVISNAHVVVYGNKCIVSVPVSGGGFYNYAAFAITSSKEIDRAIFFLSNTELGGVQQGPIGDSPSASTLVFAKNYKYCNPSDVQIGDQVYILGYPAIGGSSLTITEGIISGTEGSFYKTSAKIDHGNSGGAAILGKKNCYLGIPTFVKAGDIESLGYIMDMTFWGELLQ